jgi:hypothetical protein
LAAQYFQAQQQERVRREDQDRRSRELNRHRELQQQYARQLDLQRQQQQLVNTSMKSAGRQPVGYPPPFVRLSSPPVVTTRGNPPPSPLSIPKEGVDMPWVGHAEPHSELGYRRNAKYFWEQFHQSYPEQLSPDNQARVQGKGKDFRSPRVDATWILHHPEEAPYLGDTLDHHHVGQGSRCVPISHARHGAQKVFHPERQEVGSGSKPLKALKPLPTAEQTRADILRYVKMGKIRGPGISPETPPEPPKVPLSSEVAGLPSASQRVQSAPGGASGGTIELDPAPQGLRGGVGTSFLSFIAEKTRQFLKQSLDPGDPGRIERYSPQIWQVDSRAAERAQDLEQFDREAVKKGYKDFKDWSRHWGPPETRWPSMLPRR